QTHCHTLSPSLSLHLSLSLSAFLFWEVVLGINPASPDLDTLYSFGVSQDPVIEDFLYFFGSSMASK
ncbi:hypothetical protein DPEC_G00085320, partial [Dallia pectoralis]